MMWIMYAPNADGKHDLIILTNNRGTSVDDS